MRILQVVPSLDVGGAERIAALLALALRREGDEVALVSLYGAVDSWLEGELRGAGIELRFLGKRPGLDPAVALRLARVLRALAPDVVHTHLHALKYALAARSLSGRHPVVVHTVHNLAEHEAQGLDRSLNRVAFRLGAVPVAIGDEVARSLRRTYGIEPRWTIPNGVPVADFEARADARGPTRARLGLDPGLPVLLSAGRLNPQKNHAGLLEAFADPRLAALGAVLLIAGDGELRRSLEARAAEPDLKGRVRFLGVVSDLPELLAAADAFALSSSWEGNPLVVMEAMAAGRPVVATRVGCVPELVTAETGLLVPPGDAGALALALVRLLADRAHAELLGAAGAARAKARFDVPVMARAYRALYGTVASRRLLGRDGGLAARGRTGA